MDFNGFIFTTIIIGISIIIFTVLYDDTESQLDDRKIVCVEGYKYITVREPYFFAMAPLIKDDKFVRCGYNG